MAAPARSAATTKLLQNQLKKIQTDPVEGFTVDLADDSNLYEWKIYVEGPKDSPYEGGIFELLMTFPNDYPMSPPTLKFVSEFWHPNVYSDGRVCISILHPPGRDEMSGERPEERWLPTQGVTSVVLSVMSMFADPNFSSPANVDASVECRRNPAAYKARIRTLVEKSLKLVPSHIKIPHPDTDPRERKELQERLRAQEMAALDNDVDYDPDEFGGGMDYGSGFEEGEDMEDEEESSSEIERRKKEEKKKAESKKKDDEKKKTDAKDDEKKKTDAKKKDEAKHSGSPAAATTPTAPSPSRPPASVPAGASSPADSTKSDKSSHKGDKDKEKKEKKAKKSKSGRVTSAELEGHKKSSKEPRIDPSALVASSPAPVGSPLSPPSVTTSVSASGVDAGAPPLEKKKEKSSARRS
jgi:ubiquitin-conjugating enzyme E2 R